MITFSHQIEFYKDPAARACLLHTPDPMKYNMKNCMVRQEIMCWVKELAAAEGFKTIVPFNDRQNKLFTCITLNCDLCWNLNSARQ
jgi:hypothetical protein